MEGVTCPDDVTPGSARWEYFRAFFTGDVNAAVGRTKLSA
jgi:D-amino peptidase